MICSCPKCGANSELDLSQVPDEGTSAKCAACNSVFLVNRESIACRATRKAGEIYCARCGTALDASLVCGSCGEMYPDYFVAETPEAVRQRRLRMMIDTLSHLNEVSFTRSPRRTPTIDYRRERRPTAAAEKPREGIKEIPADKARTRYVRLAVVLLITLLFASGGLLYSRHKAAQQKYVINYVRTISLIKIGTDLSIKACSRMANEWRTKPQAGGGGAPAISAAEETALTKVKAEVDVYMQKTYNPPKAFASARESLTTLQQAYLSLHTLALSPPGTLSAFTDAVSRSEADFKKAAQTLKAGLPDAISAELAKGAARGKSLKDF